MNILILEDENFMAEHMKDIFSKLPFVNIIEIASNFKDGLHKSLSGIFDIILVDIFLGKGDYDGLELCKIIRKNDKNIPIIIITAFNSLYYLEKAFDIPVNDYITKPFNARELEIRVKRWFFVNFNVSPAKELISYNELSYDVSKHQFFYSEKLLDLTKKNKTLLLIFMKNPEKLLDRWYLQEKLWGDISTTDKKRNIRSNIQILRKALEGKCDSWVKTVKGEGYILIKNDFKIY